METKGELFRTRFCNTVEIPNFLFKLDTTELHAHDRIIRDNGQTHFRYFVNERKLLKAGFSGFSLEGIYFSHLHIWTSLFLFQYLTFFVSGVDALDTVSDKGDVHTRRMIKKAEEATSRLSLEGPDFLNHSSGSRKKRIKGSDKSSKTPFEPSWGICT